MTAAPIDTTGTHLLLAGTKKGVFIGRAPAGGRGPGAWRFSGPHCSGTWSFFDVRYDPASGVIYAGGQSNWYGAAVWRSPDLGQTWTHSSDGLAYADGPVIEQVWRVYPCGPSGRTVFAGVDPAGLFRSDDGGQNWQEVDSLRHHPTSAAWSPTNGGLPLHTILPKDGDASGAAQRLWVAVSAGGIYGTEDGGQSWTPAPLAGNACVHALVQAADGALYQQNHAGVWRSNGANGQSGGAGWSGESKSSWTDVSAGLPSRFGFPLAAHPRHPGTLYAVPLQGAIDGARHVPDDGMAVWRTRDGGASWHSLARGLPHGPTYLTVLRGALAVDRLDPAGVFFGSPTGLLFGSADEGDTWFEVARGLPPIFSVSCAVL